MCFLLELPAFDEGMRLSILNALFHQTALYRRPGEPSTICRVIWFSEPETRIGRPAASAEFLDAPGKVCNDASLLHIRR